MFYKCPPPSTRNGTKSGTSRKTTYHGRATSNHTKYNKLLHIWKLYALHFVVTEYFTSVGDRSTEQNTNVVQLPLEVSVFPSKLDFFSFSFPFDRFKLMDGEAGF